MDSCVLGSEARAREREQAPVPTHRAKKKFVYTFFSAAEWHQFPSATNIKPLIHRINERRAHKHARSSID